MRGIDRLEKIDALDRVSQPLMAWTQQFLQPRAVRNLLSGTDLGHPLHPMLTDVPIGAWTMSAALDVFGDRSADGLIALGILAAVPTAATGLNDWSDTYGAETRLGLVHAAANTAALALYTGSLLARLVGRRRFGRRLSWAGLGLLLGGGYLGGHLSYVKGVNVNHTAFDHPPGDWTAVATADGVPERTPTAARAGDVDVLLYRDGTVIHALAATCTHAGGPLAEGTVTDGCVRCPWHGSMFRLEDGSVYRGPASTPQPRFEARVAAGTIEVRPAP